MLTSGGTHAATAASISGNRVGSWCPATPISVTTIVSFSWASIPTPVGRSFVGLTKITLSPRASGVRRKSWLV
ncbi:hypothetical protein A5752_22385 [Mycobacterium sp. 852002-51961_SCH5331710]|nr:hypothetical protein A5752_22385 [Mycobacterium sp. 852002-51961_SCH5331710]OBH00039.1 hypothetical protein A5698_09610 [Mycobacterium sp. E136]